jgi:hypothetical protein
MHAKNFQNGDHELVQRTGNGPGTSLRDCSVAAGLVRGKVKEGLRVRMTVHSTPH